MKNLLFFVVALAVALTLGEAALFAQHGGGHGGGPGGGPGMAGGGPGMAGGNRGGSMGRGDNSMGSMHPMQTGSSMGKQSPTEILSKSSHLSSKLQSLLPAGTNLTDAASGFKNLGQFVAAVHVSHNLNIPFSDLKSKMMAGDSLGKAIEALDANANAKQEAKKANKQSKEDLNEAATEANEGSRS